MGMTFEVVSVAYLVPASACDLNTTVTQQGLMASMPLLGIIASSHFLGYMADTRGRRRVLGWSMWVAFVCGAAAALSPNWIVFCVLKFMSAGALAGTIALSLTWLSECTPQNRRSILVSLTTTIYLVTTGCMAVLAIPVLQLKFSYYIPYFNIYFTSWRLLNLVFASTCAVGAICMFCSYESPRYYLCMGEEEKALEVLRGIYAINSGNNAEDYEVTSVVLGEDTGEPNKGMFSSMLAQTLPLLKPPLLKNTVLLAVLFIIAYTGISPFILWLPFIADSIMKAKEKGEANMSFCQMLLSTQNSTLTETSDCSLNTFALLTVCVTSITLGVVNIVLSTVVNYVGRKRMVIAVQIVAGTAGLCVNATNSWIIGTVCLMVYLSGTVNFGFVSTFSVDVFPTYVKAMAVCLTLMIGRVSSVLGINILKNLLVTDCQLAFYCFAGLTFIGGFVALLLPDDVKKYKKGTAEVLPS
ncbi:putative transporter svop-1 isoform X2 [Maniola hyperantus]